MNKNYNLKLDLQFRCNNSIMKFNQFDNNTSDFFMRITNGGNLVDIEKALVVLAAIKPSGKVASQFVEVKNGLVYADLKPSMKDEIGTYAAQAMLILEDERVVTDAISYEVEEDKIFSLLNDTVGTSEEFTLLTDMLSRLSAIEISEEQRMINEAERILSEENRKIEEAKRVEAELVRQHEEADRTKYDATRESNENIRKINEEARISSENARLENEANRIEQEANRVKAEQLRKDNYNFMTEDEERRRLEANAHKEAEVLRVQAETNRVNEEAKRRTTEQARVSAENTRVNNENTRKANETTRQTNETQRVEAETQRQNRYNSFISDAEANASNFENYTNTAKVKEEERKSNELDRKSQEDRRVSNEVERISNENTRKANEVVREKNEASRQDVFENKVDEVDKKIVELNTTKDNFISSINTKVDNKISEIDNAKDNFVSSINTKVDTKISEIEVAKSDMTNTVSNKLNDVDEKIIEINATKDDFVSSVNTKVDNKISELDNAKSDMATTVSNKVNEVETRFNALTSSQQQDAEVIDARVDFKGVAFGSLKERIDNTDKLLRDSTVSTVTTESDFTTVEATSNGYFEDVKLEGKTLVNITNKVVTNGNVNTQYTSVGVSKLIKPNTIYTYVIQNLGEETFRAYLNNYTVSYKYLSVKVNEILIGKCVSIDNPQPNGIWLSLNTTQTLPQNIRLMLLEGDHTQNPPSYFEGLKSVGQSATTSGDGVDEINVESVNENLFDMSSKYEGAMILEDGSKIDTQDWRVHDFIKVKPNGTYYLCDDGLNFYQFIVVLYDSNKNFIGRIGRQGDASRVYTMPSNAFYCRINYSVSVNGASIVRSNIMFNEGTTPKPYTPRQSDKKRLLYYNEETQAWEKPILRKWDSIEKHANGKYYYHQRSGAKVLNGSENWNNDENSSTISPATYRQSIQFNAIDIPNAAFNTKTSPNIISDLLPTVIFGDVYSYNHIGISISGTDSVGTHIIINNNFTDVTELKKWLQTNNVTVVYQLAQEKVYECTNIDLITYANETNFIVESGVLSPKTTLKVHSNISNVVSLLQKKVSLLESDITGYMITQNRLMLASRYNADTVSFKVDVASFSDTFEYDNDLYELILNNILVGKDNYNREYIENLTRFYWMDFVISDEMYSTLFEMIEEQHNPKIEEETPLI